MSFFDECYRTFADSLDRPKDFDQYWTSRIKQISRIPLEVHSEKKMSRKILKESKITIHFQSSERVQVRADLIAPRKMRGKPPVVVLFPDYMEEPAFFPLLQDLGLAQVVLHYRGQDEFFQKRKQMSEEEKEKAPESLGFFRENLDEKDNFYMGHLYLDAYRLLEVIRLQKNLDSSRIGIWGRGIGSALALFVTRYMNRTSFLILESPSFCHLEVSQNKSKALYAKEINTYIRSQRKSRSKIKENLKYFDSLFFTDRIFSETVSIAPFQKTNYVPQSAFALFHAIPAEKTMVVYTKESKLTDDKLRSHIIRTSADFLQKALL